MDKKFLTTFFAFVTLFLCLGLLLLDGGLFFISVLVTSLYVSLSFLVYHFSRNSSAFMKGFLIAILCATSPFILETLLHFYSLCKCFK